MKKKINYLLLLTLVLVNSAILVAQSTTTIPVNKRPSSPIMAVNDFAKKLSPLQLTTLEQKIRDFYNQTSNEIVVVTLDSLKGFEADDVTYEYFKQWQIGNKAKDNGILLLLSFEPRKVRFEVGKGLEGALPDGMAGTIIRNQMAPLLKQGQVYEALDAGVTASMQATKGEYKMDDESDRRSGKRSGGIIPIIIIVIVLIMIFIIFKSQGPNGGGSVLTRRGYRQVGVPTIFDYGMLGGLLGGGGGSGSSGGGGGGFGDFGGFGGGSSGGGGATGDW